MCIRDSISSVRELSKTEVRRDAAVVGGSLPGATMFSWFYRDVDISWHTTGGLRLCVARPRAPRDDLTVALWFSGGGLFRINPWLLSYCVRAYAARGHVIVAPIYATSRPRIFVWLQTAVVCAISATAASYLPPEAASPSLKWVAVAAVSFCFAVFRLCLLYTSPSPRDQRGSRMPSSA